MRRSCLHQRQCLLSQRASVFLGYCLRGDALGQLYCLALSSPCFGKLREAASYRHIVPARRKLWDHLSEVPDQLSSLGRKSFLRSHYARGVKWDRTFSILEIILLYEVLGVLVERIDRGLEGLASYQKQDKRRLVTEGRSGATGKYLYVDPPFQFTNHQHRDELPRRPGMWFTHRTMRFGGVRLVSHLDAL